MSTISLSLFCFPLILNFIRLFFSDAHYTLALTLDCSYLLSSSSCGVDRFTVSGDVLGAGVPPFLKAL